MREPETPPPESHDSWLSRQIPVGKKTRNGFKVVPERGITPKQPIYLVDLHDMEDRLGKLILRLCIVMGSIGALAGFIVFVIVGIFI